jgi:hypothetical protein
MVCHAGALACIIAKHMVIHSVESFETRIEEPTYDDLYQVDRAAVKGSTADDHSFDAVGNRLSSLGVSPYSYNRSNELTSAPKGTFTYDGNGNTDSNGTTTYTWDFEIQLASVTLPNGGGTVSFKYDPFELPIEKICATCGTTIYAYDGDITVEKLEASGTATARYTQGLGIDGQLKVQIGRGSYYYSADGPESVFALAKSNAAAVNTYSGYNTFG